jgi:hypothetical protein
MCEAALHLILRGVFYFGDEPSFFANKALLELMGLTPPTQRTAGHREIIIGLMDGPVDMKNVDLAIESVREMAAHHPGQTGGCRGRRTVKLPEDPGETFHAAIVLPAILTMLPKENYERFKTIYEK